MPNKQEIAKMAKIIDNTIYQYASNPNPPERHMHECIAIDLAAHGIGDKIQAMKEFGQKVKKCLNPYKALEVEQRIDKLIKEFTENV